MANKEKFPGYYNRIPPEPGNPQRSDLDEWLIAFIYSMFVFNLSVGATGIVWQVINPERINSANHTFPLLLMFISLVVGGLAHVTYNIGDIDRFNDNI